MTLRSEQHPLSVLQGAQVRFINDERSGSLIVEQTTSPHSGSFDTAHRVVDRVVKLSGLVAPGVVLLLDERDQLAGSGPVDQLLQSEPARFNVVHAVCFLSGFQKTIPLIRQRKLMEGVWEMTLSLDKVATVTKGQSLELQFVKRWLESALKHRGAAAARSAVAGAASPSQHDDDDARSHSASSLSRLSALRDRLRKEVELISAADWAKLAGNSERNPSAALGKYKARGRLFAVVHGNRDLYPAFQFADDTKPKPAIAEVLARVPEAARGWPLLSWFNAGNVFLKDQKPMEVIDSDPQAVAEAADRFFGRDD